MPGDDTGSLRMRPRQRRLSPLTVALLIAGVVVVAVGVTLVAVGIARADVIAGLASAAVA